MQTDIILRADDGILIIDTKYYTHTLQSGRGDDSVHSGHLYQLYAHLKNYTANRQPSVPVDGMLLYPTVDETLDLSYDIDGHAVRVCTVDLAEPWQTIRSR